MQNGMSVKFARRLFGGRFIAIACAMVFLPLAACAQSPGRQVLHGHVPPVVARLQPVGLLPGTNRLDMAIGLPLRNEEALTDLIEEIYNPASPKYHQYLTPKQFTEQFGPTEEDYQTVLAFAKRSGLTVTATSANRVLVNVSGSVANIEKAFQVTMRTYRHPTENRTFYAPDVEPSVEAGVPILDISGLSDYALPHPKNLKLSPLYQQNGSGSGPSGAYMGNDFRAAYVPGVSLRGSGQTVGLLEFDGYYANDITNYEGLVGMTNVPLQNVLLNGVSGTPGYSGIKNAVAEVSLDIEMAVAMAPALAQVIVFEGNGQNGILNNMAASNQIKQLSCSWGWSGGPNATTDNIFKQMATQGQSFFNASGDSDAFTVGSSSTKGVDNTSLDNAPASCPYITQVGGTTLTTIGAGGSWSSETVWNWDNEYPGSYDGVGSSGGISSYYSIPSWQTNVSMAGNGGSASYRNIPDVALTADNIYVRYNNGSYASFGGTSCAAPLWAGFTALVNEQAAVVGGPAVGFINPAIYAIGNSGNYTADFHDITTGNNTWSGSSTNYYAVSGYDLCTGWGTPAGQSLIDALAGVPESLGITPATGFTAGGAVGGPFGVTEQDFLLTNSGTASLEWSLINTSLWLTVSSSSGSLPSGGSDVVSVSLNPAVSNLLAGTYTASIFFTNLNDGVGQGRQFRLLVGPLVQNGDFETGDFSYWTLSGNTSSIAVRGYPYVHSGAWGAGLTASGSLGYISQTLPTIAGQNYLLSLWLNNHLAKTPNEFLVMWNGNTNFVQVNMPQITTWTNLLFLVTATTSNTVLQFGFRNDNGRFGLDDVNVWPIPVPSFQLVAETNNTVTFTWNSVTSLVYQVEYSTNLAMTNWMILSTNTATNSTATVITPIGPDPERFYRIRWLP
jgi:subtilase family serine protease